MCNQILIHQWIIHKYFHGVKDALLLGYLRMSRDSQVFYQLFDYKGK